MAAKESGRVEFRVYGGSLDVLRRCAEENLAKLFETEQADAVQSIEYEIDLIETDRPGSTGEGAPMLWCATVIARWVL